MLLDTQFLISLERELVRSIVGPARRFLGNHRNAPVLVSVVSLGEIAAGMRDSQDARALVSRFTIVRLCPEIAIRAADLDKELIQSGERLGENDTWIAGTALYYGVPLVSNDQDFERVQGLRLNSY